MFRNLRFLAALKNFVSDYGLCVPFLRSLYKNVTANLWSPPVLRIPLNTPDRVSSGGFYTILRGKIEPFFEAGAQLCNSTYIDFSIHFCEKWRLPHMRLIAA